MNVDELIKLSKELNITYEEEKKKYDSGNYDKEIVKEEIDDISREIDKVNKLIDIYQYDDKNYIVMRLERLYMMMLFNLDEDKFNTLSEEKMYKLFDKSFPNEWVYKYSNEKKEEMLLDAICGNKVIFNKKIRKFIITE